ncbi:hypothetical protein [Parablautia sp. Marseille-Q6255]|uniref:hypothetical protein n=1 Tax=Parablautia sp. Marseille-Q6255 TaxID=3039593 RepID=UPI0024BC273D|nr:hypothetical protein [Parablautia sp. Marseille-Q6255]
MKENIFFCGLLCIWGIIYICIAIYIWFSKKAIAFRGSKKFIEVTDIRKYNYAMSKLYVVTGIVWILFGLFLLTGHSKWISVVGVVMVNIVFSVVDSLAIEKKYKK